MACSMTVVRKTTFALGLVATVIETLALLPCTAANRWIINVVYEIWVVFR